MRPAAGYDAELRHHNEILRAAGFTVDRLREEFDAHLRDDGVWFDSRAWLITARRRAG